MTHVSRGYSIPFVLVAAILSVLTAAEAQEGEQPQKASEEPLNYYPDMPESMQQIGGSAFQDAWQSYARAISKAKKTYIGKLNGTLQYLTKQGKFQECRMIKEEIDDISKASNIESNAILERKSAISAQKTYRKKLTIVSKNLVKALEKALRTETKNGNFDAAAKIRTLALQYKHPGGVLHEGSYYKVFTSPRTWKAAFDSCKKIGGHLACAETVAEAKFIAGIIPKGLGDGGASALWVGATDQKKEGVWVWITGKKVDYSYWHKGEPNNAGKKEHYMLYVRKMVIYPWGRPVECKWYDGPAHSKNIFACEWEL